LYDLSVFVVRKLRDLGVFVELLVLVGLFYWLISQNCKKVWCEVLFGVAAGAVFA
jgi:asparagine N-glycosylation enzyme membrane subunit Stt3